MKRLFICIFLAALILPRQAAAVEVDATVDRVSVSSGDVVRLSVSIGGGEGSVDASSIRDFQVIDAGTSTSMQIVNGGISRQVVHTYNLVPLKEGRLTVPPLKVSSGGKTYTTDPIAIRVGDKQQQGETTPDVFVEADVSVPQPYEGQQILYTFRISTAVPFTNVKFQAPSFEGFSARQIDDQKSYKKVVSDRQYDVVEVYFVLVPLKAGTLRMEPALLGGDILTGRKTRFSWPFGIPNDPFFERAERKRKILKTEAIDVQVRKLPAYDGAEAFSGLVGQFRINVELEKNAIEVGESTTLSIQVSGAGNVMDARLPEINPPEGLKAYQDAPEESISVGRQGYFGKKTFRTALVPSTPGQFVLGPVALTFFNPAKGAYETVKAGTLELKAEASKVVEQLKAAVATPLDAKAAKRKVEFTGRDILPLKDGLDALESAKSIGLERFYLYLASPPFFYLALLAFLRFGRKRDDPASIMAKRAEEALKNADNSGNDFEKRLESLHRALLSAIFSKGGVKGESLTGRETIEMLEKSGVDSETAAKVSDLLTKIESARYGGPKENEFLDELSKDATETVRLFIR